MRLIDADALKPVMCVSVCGLVQPQLCTCGCAQALAIDNAPTIEAEPIRHGHWIDKPTGKYGNWQSYCSACGKHSQIGGIENNRHKPRCPWCGAFMDEVNE